MKLVQQRAGNILKLIVIGKDFLNKNSKGSANKGKDRQMGLHEIKIFCKTKEMVSKLKRPPTEWEKIFASYNLTRD
jgi:hypothetical protein